MLRDQEGKNPDSFIVAREHALRKTVGGRTRYPFKGMLIGDYFRVYTIGESILVRSALQSFYRRTPTRKFTVRQREDGEWICRRVS